MNAILPLKRGNLPIKDSLGQNELVPRCPLLRGFTVLYCLVVYLPWLAILQEASFTCSYEEAIDFLY